MSANSRATFAQISKRQLVENLKIIRGRLAPRAFLCPMVKADAYGHGDLLISKILDQQDISALGVISVEEAVGLRGGGVKKPILTFGVPSPGFVSDYERYQITPVVSEWSHLSELEDQAQATMEVHLKFNTGMNRLGFLPEEASKLAEKLGGSKKIRLKGLCTHFLNGEDIDDGDGFSREQVRRFSIVEKAFEALSPPVHYLNSAALFTPFQPTEANVLSFKNGVGARPGISLYGLSPLTSPRDIGVKPILSIHSRLERVLNVKSGEVVSYGPRWKAQRTSKIGVVSIGYADGFWRSLTNQAEMIFRGLRVPVVGTVCMDYCMVDLTDVRGDVSGGEGIIVVGSEGGQEITVREMADRLGTISYEILTRLGRRVSRLVTE